MMNKWTAGVARFVAAGFLLSVGGCASVSGSGDPDPARAVRKADEDGMLPYRRTGERMLEAYKRNDCAAFLKELPADQTELFGEKGFKALRKGVEESLGTLDSYEFLCRLEMPSVEKDGAKQAFCPLVWKVRFSRKNNAGHVICQEALFRTLQGMLDGRPCVLTFQFL